MAMDMASTAAMNSNLLQSNEIRSEEEWRALANAATEPNPFYHPAILRAALRNLDSSAEVRMIEARDDGGQLIGLLPVIAKPNHGRYPLFNIANWMHGQCFYGAPLLLKGYELPAWDMILHQLDEGEENGYFLHLDGLDADGPVALALDRSCALEGRRRKRIASYERAMLRSGLDAENYLQSNVRSKKRKELRRLVNRLQELGTVTHRSISQNDNILEWTEDFLALEAAGWKGEAGTALASEMRTREYFSEIIMECAAMGMLDMLRIDLDGEPIAMLVNFRMGRGAFSYKIAFDERLARFSPGVLIEMDNMRAALSDTSVDWSDSCAAPNHPMIDGLWSERRTIAQYRVQLKGHGSRAIKRRAAFTLIDGVEAALHKLKRNRK